MQSPKPQAIVCRVQWLAWASLAMFAITGCFDATQARPHSPESLTYRGQSPGEEGADRGHSSRDKYNAAVRELVRVHETIKRAFTVHDLQSAHGPLHRIPEALEAIDCLSEAANLTPDQLRGVKYAVDELSRSFDAVDRRMHGKDGLSYDDVSARIADGILILVDSCSESMLPGSTADGDIAATGRGSHRADSDQSR